MKVFKKIRLLYLYVLSSVFLVACVSNDYKSEYQKELIYDGYNIPLDTISMKTYTVDYKNDVMEKQTLAYETTKWYDYSGYHSMTISKVFHPEGIQMTTEQITRDKYSLPIARNIKVESPDTEPVVTLARLKRRTNGSEEWLYRHYLDAQKYLEDASVLVFSEDARILKKKKSKTDSLQITEIDYFDTKGRVVCSMPSDQNKKLPYTKTYYNQNGYVDSVVARYYVDNDTTKQMLKRTTERYEYDMDGKGLQKVKYTYRNDSLTYITEYKYGFREIK